MIAHEILFEQFGKIDLQILNTRKIKPFFWNLLEKQLGERKRTKIFIGGQNPNRIEIRERI